MRKIGVITVLALAVLCVLAAGLGIMGDDEKEEKIDPKDLPQAVKDTLKEKYPDATIEEAEKEVEDGVTTYEVELKQDDKEIEVELTADGKIIEEEADDDDDDDDDDD